jgi:hypothetical protein
MAWEPPHIASPEAILAQATNVSKSFAYYYSLEIVERKTRGRRDKDPDNATVSHAETGRELRNCHKFEETCQSLNLSCSHGLIL